MGTFYERTSHRVYELAVLVTAPVCGVLLAVLDIQPRSVETAMPEAMQVFWEFGLIVVGVAGLVGMFWPGELGTGLGIELAVVLTLGAIAARYVVAVVAVAGGQAVVVASFVGAVTLGSWLRAAEIVRSLRMLTACTRLASSRAVRGRNDDPAVGRLALLGPVAALRTRVVRRGQRSRCARHRRHATAEAEGRHAGALTDAASALVQSLRTRVTELETEALAVREHLAASQRELQELRTTFWDLTRTLQRWRDAILAPGATIRRVQALVTEEDRRARHQGGPIQ
ncbi:hypothetical protein [Micromonospora sp. NPDC048830]|uniref:hypothetical protein n=1 Tax=Micromonospora sp. NPDC048830 TaxID=3364257 RepID=UPI003715506C